MYLLYRLLGYVPLLVMGGLVALLEQRYSLGVSAFIYATLVVLMTLAGAMLLRSTEVGQRGWRNVWASWLLPCSGMAGYGSLQKLCLFNVIGLIGFGLATYFVARYFRHSDYALDRAGGWTTIACALAWLVLVGMALFLVRQYGKNYYAGTTGMRKFLKLISVPLGTLAGSIVLFVAGLPAVAFLVAAIPIVIIFAPMAFLLMIVFATQLSGKPFRWN